MKADVKVALRGDREGFALVLALLVVIVVGSVAAAAAVLGSNSFVVTMQDERRGVMIAAADAALEETRARLNGNPTLYPQTGFDTLEAGVVVVDANGDTVPGLTRWTYVGPTGITTGQYGVFGSIVSVVEDGNGDRIIRRLEIVQESFARYAYFTNFDYSNNIWFGGGDVLFGPVHSNDRIGIHSTGATFNQLVTTAQTIVQRSNGTYLGGYQENVPVIPLPTTATLNNLRNFAVAGGTRIVGSNSGGSGRATTRIEFVAVDLDNDNLTTGPDEGFMRVYQSNNTNWVTAVPSGNLNGSDNCGDWHNVSGVETFFRAPAGGHPGGHSATQSLQQAARSRCYLGGSDSLFNGFQATDVVGPGSWLPWTGTVDSRLTALGRPDAAYLWPLSRNINPNFKGVVFVDGKVVISGTVRARLTLAATNQIVIGDDVRYATDPAAGTCADILGLFSDSAVVIADNAINSPWQANGSGTYNTYEQGTEEFVHAVILSLDEFTAQNYGSGSDRHQPCNGTQWGRGCLFLTGGVIQNSRGAVGQIQDNSPVRGTGYIKRYAYDACAASDPPPYFPTTGHFLANRYYDVDPTGFDIAAYFATLTP